MMIMHVYMLDSYIYYWCIVKLLPIITGTSTYIHDKHQLPLTHDWLQYACCIGSAHHNSLIIKTTTMESRVLFLVRLHVTFRCMFGFSHVII